MGSIFRRFAKGLVLLTLTLPGIAFADDDTSSTLRVEITNVRQNQGNVVLQLFHANADDDLDTPLGEPLATRTLPAGSDGTVSFDFHDIEEGLYAVVAFHDLNENGKADHGFFSGEKEPVVISNLSRQPMSAPKFSTVGFHVGQGDERFSFALFD